MAGAPFDALEAIATPQTLVAARELLGNRKKTGASTAESALRETLVRELSSARVALLESARKFLPRYLIFGAEHVRELVPKLLAMAPVTLDNLPPRKKLVRARERHLLLFLQRIAAKNDTLSEFGPASWARIDNKELIGFAPEAAIVSRESFLERWTA